MKPRITVIGGPAACGAAAAVASQGGAMAGVQAGFELTEHTADVGIRAWGPSAAEVFAQAALGMLSLMYDAATVAPRERMPIELDAPDGELLLAAWLNELLYVVDARRMAFARVEVDEAGPLASTSAAGSGPAPAAGPREVDVHVPWHLRAAGVGEAVDARRHTVRSVVKAATLHGLSLERIDDGWRCHVLLDV